MPKITVWTTPKTLTELVAASSRPDYLEAPKSNPKNSIGFDNLGTNAVYVSNRGGTPSVWDAELLVTPWSASTFDALYSTSNEYSFDSIKLVADADTDVLLIIEPA